MSDITLKNQISGYYYINSSNNDKQVYVYFRVNDESYILNFIFPKHKVTYCFFYKNSNDDKLWISTKAGNSLSEAMDQKNFSIREKIQLVIIADLEKKSINFLTKEDKDKSFSTFLFDNNEKTTPKENDIEVSIRRSILNGNAGSKLTGWIVDGSSSFSFIDTEFFELVQLVTKLFSLIKSHSLGSALLNIPAPFITPMIKSMSHEIKPTTSTKISKIQ
jgi:hypothetical protein